MDITKPSFVEAAIYIAPEGEYAGKYVAGCAKDECGYIGEFPYVLFWMCVWSSPAVVQAPLEKFYDKLGPIEAYARRGRFSLTRYIERIADQWVVSVWGKSPAEGYAHLPDTPLGFKRQP
jgi:hypothetical protein